MPSPLLLMIATRKVNRYAVNPHQLHFIFPSTTISFPPAPLEAPPRQQLDIDGDGGGETKLPTFEARHTRTPGTHSG